MKLFPFTLFFYQWAFSPEAWAAFMFPSDVRKIHKNLIDTRNETS